MKIINCYPIYKIITVLCFFIYGNTFAQNKKPADKILFGQTVKQKSNNPNNGKIRCATVEYEKYLQKKNPGRMTEAQFEIWLAPLVQKQKALKTNSKTKATVVKIPVVVHVIHNGEAIGTAPNITDAQVQSQITVLNQDFRKMTGTPGHNSNPVGADVEIEFILAKVDPDGNPTNGINRVKMCQPSWLDTEVNNIIKPATIWNPNQYMNMWSVKFTDSDLLGYAQFPDGGGLIGLGNYGGSANTDGVVSNYDVFGSSDFGSNFLLAAPYDKGRTMTHEVGHWLGLLHIWGDGTGDESNNNPDCTASDYCDDTPQVGWEHYSCPTTFDTCPSSPGNDMPENYMDYTPDTCMNIFTKDQKTRMTTILNNAPRRSSLKSSVKGTEIPLFANDAEIKIEPDFCTVNISDCSLLPAPSNKIVYLTNRGTSLLTSATINYSINGGTNQIHNWNGSLSQNEFTTIILPNTDSNGILNVTIGTTNGGVDQRVSNNTDTKIFSTVSYASTDYIFTLQRDFWGSETTWDLKDNSGIVKYSGGPYTDKPESSGVLPALITENWTLDNDQCYTFTIHDSEADGICCDGGNGYYNIKTSDGKNTVITGASFGEKDRVFFSIDTLGINDVETFNDIRLYPNPTSDYLNILVSKQFGLPNRFVISNGLGQIISQKEVTKETDLTINTSALSNSVYFITIIKNDQEKTLKFVKK